MSSAPATRTPIITPARLGNYLQKKLRDDKHLGYVGVQGEVSNLRPQANGMTYFSLKDREAVVECIAFGVRAATFPEFGDGVELIAFGEVSIFARKSVYQLIVADVELAGVGALHAKYEELKRRLDREGLFADERKRPLPRYPFRIALVGSPTGDGTNDFLTQARQRAPHVTIDLVPCAVNGQQAAPEIARAIGQADRLPVDCIVVVRGGGSYEDLFGFSDERVVRALIATRRPTIVAIGHERDVTLAELVADRSASTPSKAAQTVLPRRDELRADVARLAERARREFGVTLERARRALERIEYRSPVADPTRLLGTRRQTVAVLDDALGVAFERRLVRARNRLTPPERKLGALSPAVRLHHRRERIAHLGVALERERDRTMARRTAALAASAARLHAGLARTVERRTAALRTVDAKLDGNNPDAWLQRGYAIVTVGDAVLRDAADAPPGTRVTARLARGTIIARVEREGTNDGQQIELF